MNKVTVESSGLLLTLDRGIKVLEEIARSDGQMSARSLSTLLDINVGTMYQLIRTLSDNGYVERLPGGRYQLGPRVGFLIDRYQIQAAPPQTIIDHLDQLHRDTDETVYASLVRSSGIAIVASKESLRSLRVGKAAIGYSDHPHARASCKAFLAFAKPEDVGDYFESRDLERLTENTITDWDEFVVELDRTRQRGYAFDAEEYNESICCIGVAILDESGRPLGAYSAALPAGRFRRDRDSVVAHLLKAGAGASNSLGYVGTYPPHP